MLAAIVFPLPAQVMIVAGVILLVWVLLYAGFGKRFTYLAVTGVAWYAVYVVASPMFFPRLILGLGGPLFYGPFLALLILVGIALPRRGDDGDHG